jgi:hypothetical protein
VFFSGARTILPGIDHMPGLERSFNKLKCFEIQQKNFLPTGE